MSVGVPALPLGLDPLIAEAKERARRRRFLALGALVIAAATVGATFGLRPTGGGPPARVVRSDGIRLRLPEGWYVTHRLLDDVSWPVQRFVVSSFPERFDALTAHTTYTPPQTGALVQIVEETPPLPGEHWPPRPAHLRLGGLGGMKLFGGARWDELIFRLHGRHIYAFVWIGRNAPASTRQQLLSILQGIRAR
jgi:hypothetical protein